MANTLEEAKKDINKHNAEMRERARELEGEAEDFEAESGELLEMLTALDMPERETQEIMVRNNPKLRMTVYVDLNGVQQELMGHLTSVHREQNKRGKNNVPDVEKAITACTKLCASLVVPEDGRPWHRPHTWEVLLRGSSLEKVLEVLQELLKPYQDKGKKMGSFR